MKAAVQISGFEGKRINFIRCRETQPSHQKEKAEYREAIVQRRPSGKEKNSGINIESKTHRGFQGVRESSEVK